MNKNKKSISDLQFFFAIKQVNEAETLIGPNRRAIDKIDKSGKKKNKKLTRFERLEQEDPTGPVYNFDYNLYSIKKNISVWCIDIALLTSNGQTLKVSVLYIFL